LRPIARRLTVDFTHFVDLLSTVVDDAKAVFMDHGLRAVIEADPMPTIHSIALRLRPSDYGCSLWRNANKSATRGRSTKFDARSGLQHFVDLLSTHAL
jgi:hypothetical protein